MAHLQVAGGVKDALEYIMANTPQKENGEWHNVMEECKRQEQSVHMQRDCLMPWDVIKAVNAHATPETTVATDVGQHQMWVAQYYTFKKPRTHLTSGGLGTMGYGMGAAIGAAMATGNRSVLFTGDGSFGMNLNELATAVTQKLPLTIVILNNNRLGMIRQWQSLFFGKRYLATVPDRKTDFVKLADAFGAKGFHAESLEEVNAALDEAFKMDTPCIVECMIPEEENVLPMIPPNGSLDNVILK